MKMGFRRTNRAAIEDPTGWGHLLQITAPLSFIVATVAFISTGYFAFEPCIQCRTVGAALIFRAQTYPKRLYGQDRDC